MEVGYLNFCKYVHKATIGLCMICLEKDLFTKHISTKLITTCPRNCEGLFHYLGISAFGCA